MRHSPELAAVYEPLLTSRSYDPGLREPTSERGLLAGMGLTERQAARTCGRARRWRRRRRTGRGRCAGSSGPRARRCATCSWCWRRRLRGCRASWCLGCCRTGRATSSGSQRLKDELGNRSNASSELEFDGTVAWLVGEEGRGVRTILEMVARTRLDCVLGSASGMRAAVRQAVHHCAFRSAFGRRLADQPLMRNVLADLVLESEAATVLLLWLARAVDRGETAFARLAVPVAKCWVCERQPAVVAEALECLGGNGYVEGSGMPRLYRQAPLNSIWEGSGNVQALDVLRAMWRQPAAARRSSTRWRSEPTRRPRGPTCGTPTRRARRRLVERMALALQASLLVRHAPAAVADAFLTSRLGGESGRAFGTLPRGIDVREVLLRSGC